MIPIAIIITKMIVVAAFVLLTSFRIFFFSPISLTNPKANAIGLQIIGMHFVFLISLVSETQLHFLPRSLDVIASMSVLWKRAGRSW
jgi:hypothetical protein